MKDPNCPLCNPELGNWGGIPEWVEEVKKRHFEEHCERCPACGQVIGQNKGKNENL